MDTVLRSDGPTRQPTLLLADDSVTIQRVIALTFIDEGIRVVTVNDGMQAIRVLDQSPPDIVLAGVGIAGPNGYEVAKYVKETPRLAHIPVLLSAGAFEPVDHAKATAAGCAGVLAKPFEPQRVITRVKELLSKGTRPAASTDAQSSSPAPWNTIAELPLATRPKAEAAPDIDDYFDRLDKAFALLSDASSVAEPSTSSSKGSTQRPGTPPPASIFLSESEPASIFKPEAESKATSAVEAKAMSPPKPEPPVPPPPDWTFVPARIVAPDTPPRTNLPPLADAFAALLAAEQSEDGRMGPAEWPFSPSEASVAAPDELVDQVTRRVLERVSDRLLRETVDATVSATAERLIRDEIERIKAHIT